MSRLGGASLAAVENGLHDGLSDMCLLEPLEEEAFIDNLQRRFQADQIYTYIGSVVVSVNPYQALPLYNHEVIFQYRSRNIYELPPHIYAITDDAYRSMRDRNLDQCIIISGESGAGKTEASKVIMQFVAAVSGKGANIDRVKEQLLQSNPVLEAFGNAKTTRNDNSSRFGKYMDIEFDYKGDPVGGVITNYLLEKSRVIWQSKGERNFHIFYQLLSGADTSFLKSLKLLRNPESYAFLRHGGCSHIESVDDKLNFTVIKNAMKVIGFEESELSLVFQLVACVLKLGNIHFQHISNFDGTDGCKLINEEEVDEVCDLLGCESSDLMDALRHRTVRTNTETVQMDLSATEATYARDALCKATYSRLFSWLVARINDSIRVKSRGKRKSMGVLDIYGFEIFDTNSFEQFIINFCNEKLQQLFIELTLREEQEEYIAEGVQWINVDYFNNAVICDLIEKNNLGILAMLDEECLRPGDTTDQTFLEKLNSLCCHHQHFESRGCRKTQSDRTLPLDSFRLIHYAGAVTYKVTGFLDKNNDLLFRDLSYAMYSCSHPLLQLIFPEGNPQRSSLKRPATAGSQFKVSVNDLMRNLKTKCPNYIRCIKPNDYKRPGLFVEEIVLHQVRYLGLMENVRVRRAGYAFRQIYEQFLYRYKMLCSDTWPVWHGTSKEGVARLFNVLGVQDQECAFGVTKIFIRNPRTLFSMEDLRKLKLEDLATLLQKIWRGWHYRQIFLRMRQSQINIASSWRKYKARKEFLRIRHAAIVLCTYTRGWQARRLLKRLRFERQCVWAVGVIRKFFFGWQVRKEYRCKFRATAGPRIVNFLHNALRYRYLMQLREHLPSLSPTDETWPTPPLLFHALSEQLRELHHRWRCEKFRSACDQATRNRMREKVTASDLFFDRKLNYPRSVSHPFIGDYVNLRQNSKWKKTACDTNDQHLVFADIVMKINRRNGKMVPQLLVLSTNALLVLDQRTLVIKYRIPTSEVESLSLSPFWDKLVIFHLKKHADNGGDVLTKKGDFLLSSDHVIEIVAKMVLLVQNATTRRPPVYIGTQMETLMNGYIVEISFKTGVPDVLPGTVKIIRKGSKMDILES